MTTRPVTFTTGELAQRLKGTVRGDEAIVIAGINALDAAKPDEITFIADEAHARRWGQSRAGAVVVNDGLTVEPADDTRPVIVVVNAELATIALLELFAPPPDVPDVGVHPSAVVDDTAALGDGVRIGPLASVGRRAVLGESVVLHAGAHVGADVTIGRGTVIHSNTVVRERCTLGSNVVLHQNVSIGADGFGYRPDPAGRGLMKVPQIGSVEIGNDVEIGSGTCVDRGKFGATVIGSGTKIDNLVHIAHNCRIGRSCIILALAGLAGSVKVGDGAILGGQVSVRDHLKIGRNARIGAKSGLMVDVPEGANLLGVPAAPRKETLRQWAAIRKLPDLIRGTRSRSQATDTPQQSAEQPEHD